MKTRLTIQWAAGFFQGEGWAGVDWDYPRLRINHGDYDALVEFQRIVKYGNINGPYQGRGNPYWAWIANGSYAVAVADMLRPRLIGKKRAQLEEYFG